MARKQYKKYDDQKAKLDILFLILSMMAAAGAGFLACFCYWELTIHQSLPVAMGGAFLVFAGALLMLLLLLSLLFRRFKEYVMTGRRKVKKVMLPLLGVILGVGVLAGVFQLVYGMDVIPGQSSDYTSHIYLVDKSDSMDSCDPNQRRYSAISELVAGKEEGFPYMIYAFASSVDIEREMGPANANVKTREVDVGYMTNVDIALERVYSDYKNRAWDGGARPQVILITDGEISTYGLELILNNFIDSGIPISTVHMDTQNSEGLIEIANKTGGQFVKVENVDMMNEALETAVNLSNERSLLGSREKAGGGILYGAMRVVMLTLLGSLLGFGVLLAYGRHESGRLTLIAMPIKALITALSFELLSEWLPELDTLLCLGMFALLGTAIVAKMKEVTDGTPVQVGYDDDYFDGPRNIGRDKDASDHHHRLSDDDDEDRPRRTDRRRRR